ncbi:hypothetical protein A2U01_0103410, partial [Trifolium medium]|nr:hypothetical protein [Trifolium medium]
TSTLKPKCSGLGLEAQKLRKLLTGPSSNAQLRAAREDLLRVNGHNTAAYCSEISFLCACFFHVQLGF